MVKSILQSAKNVIGLDKPILKFHIVYYLFTLLLLPFAYYINYKCDCFFNLYDRVSFAEYAGSWWGFYIVQFAYIAMILLFVERVGFGAPIKTVFVVNRLGVDILILLTSLLFNIGVYNDFISIRPSNDDARWFTLILVLLQPYFLVLIYLYFYSNSRSGFYNLIFGFYLVGAFLSGFFIGIMFYLAPLFAKRYFALESKIVKLIVPVGLLFVFMAYRLVKGSMVGGEWDADIVSFVERWLATENLSLHVQGIVSRFDSVSSMVIYNELFFNEISSINEKIRYMPWFQGYVGSYIQKIIFSEKTPSISHYVNTLLYGEDSSYLVFPLPSYFIFSWVYGVAVATYSFVLAFIGFRICRFLQLGYNVTVLFSIVLYVALFQGWFWAISNFLQATFLFFTILLLSGSIKRVRPNPRKNKLSL